MTLAILLIQLFLANPPDVRNVVFFRRGGAAGGIVIALVQAQVRIMSW
jgi:hypothetical protein